MWHREHDGASARPPRASSGEVAAISGPSSAPKSEALRHVVFLVGALAARFMLDHVCNHSTEEIRPNVSGRNLPISQSRKQRHGEGSMLTVVFRAI